MRRKKRRKVRGGRKEIVEGKIIKKRWKIKKNKRNLPYSQDSSKKKKIKKKAESTRKITD
jgi:hypothetical protein